MGVKIITDSTCYIKSELLKEYDIKIISLSVIMEGKSYREQELDNIEFYKDMDKLRRYQHHHNQAWKKVLKHSRK